MELRPEQLAAEWKSGRFRPVYYLIGEESAAKIDALITLKKLFAADDFNLREFTGDPASEYPAILSEAMTLPVFAEKRLVIVRNPRIPAAAKAALADYMRAPSPSTTLVLLSEDSRFDKKDALALAASAAGAVCVFAPLNEGTAIERLLNAAKAAGKTMDPAAAAALVAEVGMDWGLLSGELEKAVLFSGSQPTIGMDAIAASLGLRRAADPWQFERLISARDRKTCLNYLRAAFAEDKPDEVVFRSLAQARMAYLKQLKAKRMLKAGVSPRDIETRLRIFYDRDFFARAEKVNEVRLRKDLRRLVEVEADLKSKAWLNAKVELERLVVELCA